MYIIKKICNKEIEREKREKDIKCDKWYEYDEENKNKKCSNMNSLWITQFKIISLTQ